MFECFHIVHLGQREGSSFAYHNVSKRLQEKIFARLDILK